DRLRAGMEIARPRVVAQTLPGMQHVVELRQGERFDIGPALEEAREVRTDGRDRGLLQHDLAEPHAIRIGRLARQRAPRQAAAMPVVPGEQLRGAIVNLRVAAARFFLWML